MQWAILALLALLVWAAWGIQNAIQALRRDLKIFGDRIEDMYEESHPYEGGTKADDDIAA